LLLLLTLAGAWLYWNSPNLEAIRPDIEHYLQQELELEELHLGQLSWHWTGSFWLKVDQLGFTSRKHGIAFHQGSASIRVPLNALFSGEISPDHIRLSRGSLDLQFDDSSVPILPHQLTLDDTHITWRIVSPQNAIDWHGELASVDLTLKSLKRTLNITSPSLNLSVQWDEDQLPKLLKLSCNHIDWLPSEIRQHMHGSPQAEITLRRSDTHRWQLKTSISSEQPLSFSQTPNNNYQFNSLAGEFQIALKDIAPISLESIDIRELQWALAEHNITAQGQWQDGELHLKATSQQLPMSLIWSWLKPMGDNDWRDWVNLMQQGSAKNIHSDMTLNWLNPLLAMPSSEAWQSARYSLQAQIDNTDISLGASNGYLKHMRANIDLNQDAFTAQIEDTILPKGLGHSAGSLRIPWDTLDLHIKGTSNADVAKLLQWLSPADAADWTWNNARANSQFELLWDPGESSPKEARATLKPDGLWDITVLEFPLQLSHGEVQWDQSTGLSLKGMHLSSQHMQGTFSLNAAIQGDAWSITTLQADGTSQLADLAAHFQLPMSHASGNISSSLRYDGDKWSGKLDLKNASWEHLLGSDKKTGEPFALQYQGQLDMSEALPTIHLNQLSSSGNHIKLHEGSASINQRSLNIQLDGLHTPSFTGDLKIEVPFDNSMAWKVDAKASYLNRNALPATLDHPEDMIDKAWFLRADIERFDWNDARMSGVHIKLSSEQDSLGIMEAAQIHTSQLDIMDVDARFTLPGLGRVELRRFSAQFEKQRLTMSATLTPEPDGGGMRWKGFAEVHGDFGHLMNTGGLSKRFLDGDGHILFSGQGLILKEQPWWQGLDGRMRMRVDQGRILEGGTLTTLLSVVNLSQLPALLLGQRKDLSGPGILYERLQMEAIMQNQDIFIRNVAMRSSAFDLVGHGSLDVDKAMIDLYLIAKPLQNLDAMLSKIPLLRDILGGRSHSLMRKVYHLHGPFSDAKVEPAKPEDAGLASAGLIESLFSLPDSWFGSGKPAKASP